MLSSFNCTSRDPVLGPFNSSPTTVSSFLNPPSSLFLLRPPSPSTYSVLYLFSILTPLLNSLHLPSYTLFLSLPSGLPLFLHLSPSILLLHSSLPLHIPPSTPAPSSSSLPFKPLLSSTTPLVLYPLLSLFPPLLHCPFTCLPSPFLLLLFSLPSSISSHFSLASSPSTLFSLLSSPQLDNLFAKNLKRDLRE